MWLKKVQKDFLVAVYIFVNYKIEDSLSMQKYYHNFQIDFFLKEGEEI